MHKDVLVVGAGPTGLTLALWLHKQGVSVRIIDKASGPGTTSRAMAVQARTLELYRQLELADLVVSAGHPNPAINLWVKGKKRATLSFAGAGRSVTPYPFLLIYPQDQHERLLVDKLQQAGVTVEWRSELLAFEDQGTHIAARIRQPNGHEETLTATFISGCDGARSTVRKQLGTNFPGGTYSHVFYVADVSISGPAADGAAHIALDESDFVAILAYGKPGMARLIGTVRDERAAASTSLTFDDVGHHAIEHLGIAVHQVNWFSTYRVHHRVTEHYRAGQAFLLGDAAHVHSPAGGQGMNTGIGDAINLAWKIAAVLTGTADDRLLDTYEIERRAFAKKLVQTTDRVFSLVTAEGSFAKFVRTHLAPILLRLAYRTDRIRETAFRLISQTMIHYRESPVSAGRAGKVHGGDRLPWARSAQSDNYATGVGRIGWQLHVYGIVAEDVRAWCCMHNVTLQSFEWDKAWARVGLAQNALYLIRPDTYVAFASPHADTAALDSYLSDYALRLHKSTMAAQT
jgi:2-polyprenyl-6-methoxyphenol hydroxylase-like FAD-dependent oxidoreductase